MTLRSKAFAAVLSVLLGLGAGAARADLIEHTDVNGLAAFEDTDTGRVWIQLFEMFGKDYQQQVAAATTAGFTVAQLSDVDVLWASAGGLTWNQVEGVIGGSNSRSLMWGNYADVGTDNPNGWAYSFGGEFGVWSHYNPGYQSAYSDLGLWAFQDGTSTALPEPASIALSALALCGALVATRRRKA